MSVIVVSLDASLVVGGEISSSVPKLLGGELLDVTGDSTESSVMATGASCSVVWFSSGFVSCDLVGSWLVTSASRNAERRKGQSLLVPMMMI